MKRLAAVLAIAAFAPATVQVARAATIPSWVRDANRLTLHRVFGGAQPIETHYIPYPHKIAVIFEFNHVVICGACSAPSNSSLPRGRVIRLSYDRRTHRITGAYQFCEARGSSPSRASCLRR